MAVRDGEAQAGPAVAGPGDIAGQTIGLGVWALGVLQERMLAKLAAYQADPENNEPPTDTELWRLADAGQKMAGMVARSKVNVAPPDLSGFRAGATGLPSQRMGHSRLRVVDGERRPVKDEGRADRKHYNKRARQEGGPLLPE